jgi:hypothetical protein
MPLLQLVRLDFDSTMPPASVYFNFDTRKIFPPPCKPVYFDLDPTSRDDPSWNLALPYCDARRRLATSFTLISTSQ